MDSGRKAAGPEDDVSCERDVIDVLALRRVSSRTTSVDTRGADGGIRRPGDVRCARREIADAVSAHDRSRLTAIFHRREHATIAVAVAGRPEDEAGAAWRRV